jgi:hypothetical protein
MVFSFFWNCACPSIERFELEETSAYLFGVLTMFLLRFQDDFFFKDFRLSFSFNTCIDQKKLKMTLFRGLQISKIFTLLLFSGVLVFTSCKDDEPEMTTACENLAIDGAVMLNGADATLSIAQVLVNTGFDNEKIYQFQIGAAEGACTELKTVNFTVMVFGNDTLDGTYTFKTFFDADDDDAFGSILTQNLESLSQSQSDIMSGTVRITTNSQSNYTLDINAVPTEGAEVNMEITHQF